ncbi:hypothetical protein [Microbacterium mangrovi]|uniref:hypothetical protein n=1 Tax=Microbacterium mangrovi TaxID=1348253 RepID=UPI0012E05E55|nr:hypothetical protein [Microbacterium mangrovi]
MAQDSDDERFQLAVHAMVRLIRQSSAHVVSSVHKMSTWFDNAPSWTPFRTDYDAAAAGDHLIAFRQRIEHVQTMSGALQSHLQGLEVLAAHDTFHPLPATPITRAVAEISATCAWILQADINADARAARTYAALFHSIERGIAEMGVSDATKFAVSRELLVAELRDQGVSVVRRDKTGVKTDEIVQVKVGRSYARTNFQISQRVLEEIPAIGNLYSALSGATHGEYMHVAASWERPDAQARMIGMVVARSVEAWSRAVHAWVGVTPRPVFNQHDVDNLGRSIPLDVLASYAAQDG